MEQTYHITVEIRVTEAYTGNTEEEAIDAMYQDMFLHRNIDANQIDVLSVEPAEIDYDAINEDREILRQDAIDAVHRVDPLRDKEE